LQYFIEKKKKKKRKKKAGTAFPSQTPEVAPVFMEGFDLFIFLISCLAFLALRVFVLCLVPTVVCVSVLSIIGGPSLFLVFSFLPVILLELSQNIVYVLVMVLYCQQTFIQGQ
jgi:hypothetical protein